jgi:hypothetical protein
VAQFITRFPFPQPALGVAIGEGIAFIADGSGGLQVLNYLPLDTTGVPPTATITLPASTVVGTGSDGNPEVVEGSTLTIQPTVDSNVQVRNVELLVNGNVVQNAVSFPFDLTTILPTLAGKPDGDVHRRCGRHPGAGRHANLLQHRAAHRQRQLARDLGHGQLPTGALDHR